jgi:MFS family permease
MNLTFKKNTNESGYNPNTAKIALLFMSVQFIGFFYFNGFKVVFPLILENINYTESEVIVYWATIYGLGMFLGSITRYPMGIVADRLTRNQSLTLSVIVICFSTFSILFTSNIIILAIVFGLIRTGTHLAPLITRGYVNETDPTKQGKMNSYVYVFANLGGFFGPILLTFFLELSLLNLILFSNLFLFVTFVYYLFNVPPKMTKNSISLIVFVKKSLIELMNFKKVILLFITIGLINGIVGYLQVPFAIYILHLTPGDTSFILGTILLLTTVFIVFTGELVDRIGIRLTIYAGLFVIISGALIQIVDQSNVWFYFLSQFLISSGILLNTNSLVTYVTIHSSKEATSSIFGGTSSFYFFGSSLIPGITSSLYIIHPLYPFYLIILLSAVIFPFGLIIKRKKK